MSDACSKCGVIRHTKRIATGRKTPPYSFEIGGCEWYNGEFLCEVCIEDSMRASVRRTDVCVTDMFRAIGSKEKVF